jgi:lipoprotein NlpD
MRRYEFSILFVMAAVLAGCSSRREGPADVEYDAYKSPYHIVKRGETIAGIAQTYHMDKRELVRLNGMKSPYRIVVGQKLLVGAQSASGGDDFAAPASDSTAQRGEVTVSKLAPLPGTEEAGPQAPVGTFQEVPDGGEGAAVMQEEEAVDTAEAADPASQDAAAKKVAQPLGEAPKAAEFFSWPVRGKIIRGFSAGKKGHTGINIRAPKGTPVKAANNGVVMATRQIAGYGKVVLIQHQDGLISTYAHLDQIAVKRGDVVEIGQKIGTVGKTGNVSEPQLHFKLNKRRTPVDPIKYLD